MPQLNGTYVTWTNSSRPKLSKGPRSSAVAISRCFHILGKQKIHSPFWLQTLSMQTMEPELSTLPRASEKKTWRLEKCMACRLLYRLTPLEDLRTKCLIM